MSRMLKPLLLASLAAISLSACQSNGAASSNHDAAASESHNNICRQTRGDTASGGRNVLYRCNGQAVLASAEVKSILSDGATISFGGGGSVIRHNMITRQAARRFGKSDEAACERAYINAAKKFQETAAKHGGKRVTNFQSYLNKRTLGGGQYECEVGTFHARVVIQADIAR
ncbi:excinuclease [Conchiformibius steedae]|uniref:Excinuclease n=2 Tax=Conchiformibius steedae TaxID=153493 RepID=A0A3P2A3P0_9NEIS|nr:excinuclease [Conchiformibius steedae]RRD90057.1 excinuclease [Conchiformibius steedae]